MPLYVRHTTCPLLIVIAAVFVLMVDVQPVHCACTLIAFEKNITTTKMAVSIEALMIFCIMIDWCGRDIIVWLIHPVNQLQNQACKKGV